MRIRCLKCGDIYSHFDGHKCQAGVLLLNKVVLSPNMTTASPNTTGPSPNKPIKDKTRNQRWRERNPIAYREAQRALMRKRRQKVS